VLLLKVCKDLEKDGGELAWRNRIEERSDLIVARDRLDAEEGLSVIVSLTLVELALVLQKRRRLREKEAEGAQGSVLYRVAGIGAGFAKVGEASGVLTQNLLEMIKA
jgi:hypothetical protein